MDTAYIACTTSVDPHQPAHCALLETSDYSKKEVTYEDQIGLTDVHADLDLLWLSM